MELARTVHRCSAGRMLDYVNRAQCIQDILSKVTIVYQRLVLKTQFFN